MLGGCIDNIQSPDQWNKVATHKYIVPDEALTVESALIQNIEAERGAIETYLALEKFTRDIDPVSNQEIKKILADEEEHLQVLLEYLEDIKK
jgi:bacterioferritin (cytochrome b1)